MGIALYRRCTAFRGDSFFVVRPSARVQHRICLVLNYQRISFKRKTLNISLSSRAFVGCRCQNNDLSILNTVPCYNIMQIQAEINKAKHIYFSLAYKGTESLNS